MNKQSPKTAEEIFNHFKEKAGSDHIAKPTAIEIIRKICEDVKPKNILELGAGIGTITYSLLAFSGAEVDAYEQNDFCKKELKKNLRKFSGRYNLIPSYEILPPKRQYDLIIIDGAEAKDHPQKYDAVAWLFLSYLKCPKVVYIEGRRGLQRKQTRSALGKKCLFWLKRHRDQEFNGKVYPCGIEFHCRESNSKILNALNFWFWEILYFIGKIIFSIIHRIKKYRNRKKS